MPRVVDELASSPAFAPFPFGIRLGIVFIIEAACVSFVAVLGCLCFIAFSRLRPWGGDQRWSLSTPLHAYFLSMLVSELFQSVGAMMNIRWVIKAHIEQGPYCVAQGALKQTGEVTVALATLAIAIHTFAAIVLHWVPDRPRLLSVGVLAAIWTTMSVVIIVSVAAHTGNLDDYWGNTQYWCWITTRYQVQQYALDYAFMWTAALASILLYIPLAFVLKGWVIISGFTVHIRSKEDRSMSSAVSEGGILDHVAKQMLFYPFVYIVTILPIAIVRFRSFYSGHAPTPFPAIVVADVLFALSGLFNIILFSITRPSLLPSRHSPTSSDPHPVQSGIAFSVGAPPTSPRGNAAVSGRPRNSIDHRLSLSPQSPHFRHVRAHHLSAISVPLSDGPVANESDIIKMDSPVDYEYEMDVYVPTPDRYSATASIYSCSA